MSVGEDSPSGSQILSGSHSSVNQSKKASSEISKTYKHASQLYLTRRLVESYEVLQPVIQHVKKSEDETHSDDEPTPLAPVALSSTSQRIKIWSLYVTLLNAIVDLGMDEGRRDFGSKEYGIIIRNVQTGEIWEQVVQNGYQGREGSVDAEVVYNLSNLLLGQAPNQKMNQSRLETYLSSSSLDLDLSAITRTISNTRRPHMSGTDTPKDLSSRIKIIELFTLHVLPRNEEWEYAKTFINNSDVLDEERKEAFLQTLQELQDAKDHDSEPFADVEDDYGNEEDYVNAEESHQETITKGIANGASTGSPQKETSLHRRTSSEVDYGIDQARPNGSSMKPTGNGTATASKSSPAQATSAPSLPSTGSSLVPKPLPPPSSASAQQTRPTTPKSSKSGSKSPSSSSKSKPKPNSKPSSNTLLRRAQQILLLFRTMSSNLSTALTKSPAALLRTLMFLVGILVMLTRKDLRERLRQIVEAGWGKVKGTVGMGVKVSYI